MSICQNGFPPASTGMFVNPDGTLKPDVPSGYYSKKVWGINYGTLQPLTIRDIYSYGCSAASGYHSQDYANDFCSNLLDAGGNLVRNPPAVCGGTGPDVLNYNPVTAAYNDIVDKANDLVKKYDAKKTVKTIVEISIIAFVLIIIIYLLWTL